MAARLLFDVARGPPAATMAQLIGFAGSAVDVTERWKLHSRELHTELEFRSLMLLEMTTPLPISDDRHADQRVA